MKIKDLSKKYIKKILGEIGTRELFKCDKCDAHFQATSVELKKMPQNIYINGGLFCQQKIQTIKGVDYTLHCPKCKEVHLAGFDKVV